MPMGKQAGRQLAGALPSWALPARVAWSTRCSSTALSAFKIVTWGESQSSVSGCCEELLRTWTLGSHDAFLLQHRSRGPRVAA